MRSEEKFTRHFDVVSTHLKHTQIILLAIAETYLLPPRNISLKRSFIYTQTDVEHITPLQLINTHFHYPVDTGAIRMTQAETMFNSINESVVCEQTLSKLKSKQRDKPMYLHSKTKIQLLCVGLSAVVALSLLAVIISINTSSVNAQEPQITPAISYQTLAALGISPGDIQVASGPTNLEIVKRSNVTTVTSGGAVTFTMTITNHGNNPISYTHFSELYPTQMQNVNFAFSKNAIRFDSISDQHWLIYDPILVSETVFVTVTGILTSAPDITVTNTAIVTPIGPDADTNPNNNTAQAQVGIVGYSPLLAIYLPIITKSPQPTTILAYHENFDSGEPWVEYDDDNCKWYHDNGRFLVEVRKDDKECLPPARNENKPELPYRSFGEFEVTAYQDGDPGYTNSGAYGLFINGDGGDTQYIFRVWPNIGGCSTGGRWELIRKLDGNTTLLDSEACDSNIKRGYGSANASVLRIAHTSSGQLTVYINGVTVGSASDNTLINTPTGVYARTAGDSPIRIKFDDFKVYRYN